MTVGDPERKASRSVAGLKSDSLNSLFETIPTILWTADTRLHLTSVVGGGLGAAGGTADDFAGATLEQLFPNLSPSSELVRAHGRALEGVSTTIRAELLGRALHARVEPLRDLNGQIIGVIGTAHDDTEHHVIEKALRLSEESYRGLIERAPFAICQSTVSGQLLQVNHTMVEMLGYESETDLLLASLRENIHSNPARYDEFLAEVERKTLCQGFDCQWVQRDGTPIDVTVAGRALRDLNGEVSHLEILAENTTEKKLLEAQLRQGQKIQAVGQLAAGIAHDFNNLLSVISGESEMLQAETSENPQLRRRIQAIQTATEQAGKLTKQLLAFTRMQILQSKVLDLNAVIAGMHQMLVRLLGEMIQISFLPAPGLGRIKVDPSQLEQVLMNLAVNARDAMPQGGSLRIETRSTHIPGSYGQYSLEHSGEYIALIVTDTGHGIEPDTQSKIFDPFFTTKPLGQGTGLGLSVVYSVVKQCGGFIEVQSAPGKGAVFTLYFPRVSELEEEKAAGPQPVTAEKCSETILLAEDDAMNRELYVEYLRGLGYRVLDAFDDESALALAGRHGLEIDLLVTDLMMPKAGGYQLAERLQKSFPALKVILISGHFDDFGASDPSKTWPFLQKPFPLRVLAQKIRAVLSQ